MNAITIPTTKSRIATLALLAGLILATTFALSANRADAATVHSVKVCGVNASSGRAETGATIYSYYYSNGWKSYSSAKVSSTGCAWVSAPKGYYTYYRVYRSPALGVTATPAQQCRALGYVTYDDGYSNSVLIPTSTDGYNLGTLRAYFGRVSCY